MVDDGVQGALLVIGRPAPFNTGVRLVGHVVFQHLHQARFANARLTAEQHHLPLPRLRLLPALLQERHLFFPAHQGRQPARDDRLQAALDAALAQDAIHMHGRCHAFEGMRPQILVRKVALHQAEGGRTQHHGIRRRQPLQAGRNVRRLTQG